MIFLDNKSIPGRVFSTNVCVAVPQAPKDAQELNNTSLAKEKMPENHLDYALVLRLYHYLGVILYYRCFSMDICVISTLTFTLFCVMVLTDVLGFCIVNAYDS